MKKSLLLSCFGLVSALLRRPVERILKSLIFEKLKLGMTDI